MEKINVIPSETRPIVISLWFMQVIFWVVLTVVTFFSLTLWYGSAEWPHIAHTLLQSLMGFALTFPMRTVYRRTWGIRLSKLSLVIAGVVIFFAFIWSLLRVSAFVWLTAEGSEVWNDFGGWYFSGFFIFLCWTAVYYSMHYYRMATDEKDRRLKLVERSRSEKLKRVRAEKLAAESRMQMLRYQLNPHFLFNTLNAVNSLIVSKDLQQARATVESLSTFLRYALKDEEKGLVDLEKEIDALDLYLSIEKIRFEERLRVSYNVEPEARKVKVPSLILQPIVENTVKHAMNANEDGCEIGVMAYVTGDKLIIELSDNGPGIASKSAGKLGRDDFRSDGVGIKNIFDRLDNLFGDDASVTLFNRPGKGLKTTISISGAFG